MGCHGVPWGAVGSYGKYTNILVPCGVNNLMIKLLKIWCRGAVDHMVNIHTFWCRGCQQLLVLVPWGVQIVNIYLKDTFDDKTT